MLVGLSQQPAGYVVSVNNRHNSLIREENLQPVTVYGASAWYCVGVLVLGIETSSRVGKVALFEDGRTLAQAKSEEPNAHGERILALVGSVFEQAGRQRTALTHIAVGRGPGAFTGLRIGLAVAQGLAIGLGIPVVGVGSLRAMATGLPISWEVARVCLLDARRGELFVACYGAAGNELSAPHTIARGSLRSALATEFAKLANLTQQPSLTEAVLVGAVLGELAPDELSLGPIGDTKLDAYRSPETDYPGAVAVCQLAYEGVYVESPTPDYQRDADAIIPDLPPCPLDRVKS